MNYINFYLICQLDMYRPTVLAFSTIKEMRKYINEQTAYNSLKLISPNVYFLTNEPEEKKESGVITKVKNKFRKKKGE